MLLHPLTTFRDHSHHDVRKPLLSTACVLRAIVALQTKPFTPTGWNDYDHYVRRIPGHWSLLMQSPLCQMCLLGGHTQLGT